jgi:hypothetical protein
VSTTAGVIGGYYIHEFASCEPDRLNHGSLNPETIQNLHANKVQSPKPLYFYQEQEELAPDNSREDLKKKQ